MTPISCARSSELAIGRPIKKSITDNGDSSLQWESSRSTHPLRRRSLNRLEPGQEFLAPLRRENILVVWPPAGHDRQLHCSNDGIFLRKLIPLVWLRLVGLVVANYGGRPGHCHLDRLLSQEVHAPAHAARQSRPCWYLEETAILRVGIIGDYNNTFPPSPSVSSDLNFTASSSPTAETHDLPRFDAFWCAACRPYRRLHGAIPSLRFTRGNKKPLLGTC